MRISRGDWAMAVAAASAARSTCLRLKVGCALLDADGRLLTANYNGAAAGLPHCSEASCLGGDGGTCDAIHAEQNALLQVADVRRVKACYVTTAPCLTCTKLLLNTGCEWVMYAAEHPAQASDRQADLWRAAGRHWVRFDGALAGSILGGLS